MIVDKEHNHIENEGHYKGLMVNSGIDHPESFSENSVRRFLKNKKKVALSADTSVKGILDGNITVLSQAVTMVESSRKDHQEIAQEIILKCLPYSGEFNPYWHHRSSGSGKEYFY